VRSCARLHARYPRRAVLRESLPEEALLMPDVCRGDTFNPLGRPLGVEGSSHQVLTFIHIQSVCWNSHAVAKDTVRLRRPADMIC